jgi:acetyl esterase/lipase
MSPYYHVTAEFPPTYISGGNGDPLTDKQSRPFADKLRALGVPVRSVFYAADYAPALLHEYQFNLDQSAGQQTLASMLAFVRKHIGQKRTFPPKKPHRLQSAISHRF